MAVELKTVYFTPDGRHFADRKVAERHDKALEIAEYLDDGDLKKPYTDFDLRYKIAMRILDRYDVFQSDNYKPTAEEITPVWEGSDE